LNNSTNFASFDIKKELECSIQLALSESTIIIALVLLLGIPIWLVVLIPILKLGDRPKSPKSLPITKICVQNQL